MATDVKMSIAHQLPIGNVDVEFRIEVDGTYLGDVKISRGGIDWHKSHAHADQSATWAEFAAWMAAK